MGYDVVILEVWYCILSPVSSGCRGECFQELAVAHEEPAAYGSGWG